MKLRKLVSKSTLDAILNPDSDLEKKAKQLLKKKNFSQEDILYLHRRNAGIAYTFFLESLKTRDAKAYDELTHEIEMRRGNAEINIDKYEAILPLMKPLNHLFGFYNMPGENPKEEHLGVKVTLSFGGKDYDMINTNVALKYRLLENTIK